MRPHPAEDPNLYHDLLAGYPNVSVEWRGDVGSWIRRCRALIHNGCTTAVQAQIARKPVITYAPIAEVDELSPGLPNLLGEKCETLSAVLGALERSRVQDGPEALSRTIAETDAIKEIVGMVEQACPEAVGRDELKEIRAQVEKAARRGKARDARRLLKSRVFRKRKAPNKNKGKKFDAGFFGRVNEVFSAAKQHFACDVEILAPHKECYLLVPRNRN